jgi:hypothetical protein
MAKGSAAPVDGQPGIYSATYSNASRSLPRPLRCQCQGLVLTLREIQVHVYEYQFGDEQKEHVMRRRNDGWINATHILKAAGFDKPSRTRILEREVQKGVHEKIQGGYGKYQGTLQPA